MNDCVYSYIGICENSKCGNCQKYLSVNDSEGSKIESDYEKTLSKLINPAIEYIRENFKEKYGF